MLTPYCEGFAAVFDTKEETGEECNTGPELASCENVEFDTELEVVRVVKREGNIDDMLAPWEKVEFIPVIEGSRVETKEDYSRVVILVS